MITQLDAIFTFFTVTAFTITDIEEMEKELLKVMKTEFAFEDQGLRKDVRRVAAPIYDYRNELCGCISIASPIFSFNVKDREHYGRIVVETATRLSKSMGQRQEFLADSPF